MGIEGKTFMVVGYGPCPTGRQLIAKGAKKIYVLDISESMIEKESSHLTTESMIEKIELVDADMFDKIELVSANMFDNDFSLPDKVDCVIASYSFTAFINDYGTLKNMIT
jgi:ubiquinone/menaquinone biosynthesis C-methylase UbiE